MDFASQNLTAGQLNAIVKKLGGEEGAMRFLRDEIVVKVAERTFTTWRTLKLGTGLTTASDFRMALNKANCQIGHWANDILGQPAFTASVIVSEAPVNLVIASVAELGFKNGATCLDIYNRAKKLGLELCPAEVGPQLRLQYVDQPLNEWLIIAIEPISDSDGGLRVFGVDRSDDGLWLSSHDGSPRIFWDDDRRFVFVSRK